MCNAALACRFSWYVARTSTKLAKPGIGRTCTTGFVESADECQRTTPCCTALTGQEDLTAGTDTGHLRHGTGVKYAKVEVALCQNNSTLPKEALWPYRSP